jgi:geranylgeranyl diphosphate synthase type II
MDLKSIESLLRERIHRLQPSRVRDAMEYSLMAGGKRIRPRMMYAGVQGYGAKEHLADEYACALEMIHTYSLIHDDLPAMDNDDLRRGHPTCHKQFDEATAVLAGDGLLTYAFELASRGTDDAAKACRCTEILARCAGADGMILGQCLDVTEDTGSCIGWDELKNIHRFKTGELLSAPLMIASVLTGQNEAVTGKWQAIGIKIGLAFQIQDDILDVTATKEQLGKSNSDERNGKITSVSLLGKENAEALMNQLYAESLQEICAAEGFDCTALTDLVKGIQERSN